MRRNRVADSLRGATLLLATLWLVCSASVAGCVAPGSSLGYVAVEGRLLDEAGRPLGGRMVEVVLPAGYGLGGLDHLFGEPEDYGHREQRYVLFTDHDGRFRQEFGARVYHVSVFLLPPLGAFPRRPPPPVLAIRVPSITEQWYVLPVRGENGRRFRAYAAGKEIPADSAVLRSVEFSSSEGTPPADVPEQDRRRPATLTHIELRLGDPFSSLPSSVSHVSNATSHINRCLDHAVRPG